MARPIFDVRSREAKTQAAVAMLSRYGYIVVGSMEQYSPGTVIYNAWNNAFGADQPFIIVAESSLAEWNEQVAIISAAISMPWNATALNRCTDFNYYRAVTD